MGSCAVIDTFLSGQSFSSGELDSFCDVSRCELLERVLIGSILLFMREDECLMKKIFRLFSHIDKEGLKSQDKLRYLVTCFCLNKLPKSSDIAADELFLGGDFHPLKNAVNGILLFFLGICSGDFGFCEKALLCCEVGHKFLSKDGDLLSAFFMMREDECDSQYMWFLNKNLFEIAFKFSGDNRWNNALQSVVNGSSAADINEIKLSYPMEFLICHLLSEKSFSTVIRNDCVPDVSQMLSDMGIACVKGCEFDSVFSFCGKNSGLGSVRFEKNMIVSFGPHCFPLGQLSLYGIDFDESSASDRHFSIRSSEDKFSASGWVRAATVEQQLGDVWMETNINCCGKRCTIKCGMENFGDEVVIGFVFFLRCERIVIGDKTYCSDELCRYRGSASNLSAITEDEKIEIIPKLFDGPMQVIPLAGSPHFWGAHFLISYEIANFTKSYQWSIGKICQ